MNKGAGFRVTCPGAFEKYDGKTVRFLIQNGNRRLSIEGIFHVKMNPDGLRIDVLCSFEGGAAPVECLHLSQVAVDLIELSQDKGADYQIPLPLSSHFCSQ